MCKVLCVSIMVFFEGRVDGTLVGERYNPAVPHHVLSEIAGWLEQGVTWGDILSRLRPHTVPAGYPYHTWHLGI